MTNTKAAHKVDEDHKPTHDDAVEESIKANDPTGTHASYKTEENDG
jgi:hypothetical protein